MHTAHRVGHAVGGGTGSHIVRVQGAGKNKRESPSFEELQSPSSDGAVIGYHKTKRCQYGIIGTAKNGRGPVQFAAPYGAF